MNIIEKHRSENETIFNDIFKECSELANEVSFQICAPRVAEKQTNRTNPPFSTPMEYFRRAIFIPYLDSLIIAIKERFPNENNAAFNLTALHPENIQKLTLNDFKLQIRNAITFYNLEGIENELDLWYQDWKNKEPVDLIIAFDKCNFYPKIQEAIGIMLALPCTTATIERSFSTLRRVKTWLRTTMGEDRLNGKFK